MKIDVNMFQIVDDSWLITVSHEQSDELAIIHTTEYGSFTDFKSIEVENGQHRPRFCRVNIFESVPGPFRILLRHHR
ncbi:hypothetical protein I7I48_01483 [Histoplasma ohiense]|nr:hypothetical protein I7I48_01483 [Histoplasma ohiense (nom. inval.)]